MKNKSGFISMSLVYSFLIIFLFLMTAIIDCYLKKNTYLEALDKQVSQDIDITQEAKSSIFTTILESNVALRTTTLDYNDVANNSNQNGNGLYYIEDANETDENNDGYGTKIYFYRGQVSNNNVIFGLKLTRDGKKVTGNTPMCWKILRTNENGSVRLIYNGLANGTKCEGTQPYINTQAYPYGGVIRNANNSMSYPTNDNAYVGFTYGKADANDTTKPEHELYNLTHFHDGGATLNSRVKDVLEDFFVNQTNLYYSTELEYVQGTGSNAFEIKLQDEKIADAVYCNNRSVFAETVITPFANNTLASGEIDSRLGYAQNITLYKGNNAINGLPSFMCEQSIDRYTLSTVMGGTNENYNALDYAIALPTVDDIIYAGGAYQKANSNYHLKSNNSYWTMTPASFSENKAKMFYVKDDGSVDVAASNESVYIRPVISIDQATLVKKGIGTVDEPYMLN